ncbi:hypothetical protein FZEAL_9183 [Fusarium zealandicum]|uniref:Zn(2)-C6 fungal-type domain-containing protein n=1 Tax=Fusarium zealandicum TaxID=1053134 RepID=A0A8H4XGS0_9HYPO|nr:hypothetical protein FZEAL_9183 [Fusarium zealandicum]
MQSPRPIQAAKRRRACKVKQACDLCHAKKIRCDGTCPCMNCRVTNACCSYEAVPKKTGPKGPRRLPNKGKNAQKVAAEPPASLAEGSTAAADAPAPRFEPTSVASEPQQLLPVPVDVILLCLDAFFAHKYPITPILDQEHSKASLAYLETGTEQYGLLTACCSVMVLTPELIDPSISPSPPLDTVDTNLGLPSVDALISETMRARSSCDWVENPSLTTIQTSFFLFSAYFCLGKDNSAWFYLREAITTLQTLRFHEESTYAALSDHPSLAVYSRRMFWVLFITERAFALQRHRPLTLQPTIDLPADESGREKNIISGFRDLIFLFQNFDDDFLNVWNLQSSGPAASSKSLIRLQTILQSGLPHVSSCTESQKADLLVTRQWLKTMVWQLCVSKTLLSSSTQEESMSISYPVTIARDIILASNVVSLSAFDANGVGIAEKVFDIGCSLADVLAVQPELAHLVAGELGPMDYLMELLRIVSTVGGGSSRHLQILAEKVNDCIEAGSGSEQGLGLVWELDENEDMMEEEITGQSQIDNDATLFESLWCK